MIVPRSEFVGDAIGEHYDELDEFYREVWGEHVHHGLFERGDESVEEATEALIRKVAEAAQINAGDHICDVGCGYGGAARWLAENMGVRVTGLTLSEAQATYAQTQSVQNGIPEPVILLRDWLENDLPDNHFDAVIAIESTAHMPERRRVFSEMARVLKPGGRLVACIWMTSEEPTPRTVKHLLEPICREGRLAGMGSASENRAWIEAAGLTVESVEDLSRSVARTWTICAKRVTVGILRNSRYRSFLFDSSRQNRGFARTLLRLRLAYAVGAMKYGFVVVRKPI
ncbi:MAG: class I SAM-dependent methyltransferase [Bacteroidetes bacterium]|nr:class I SAM-dependent methyltransferase [Bacteroidota bacterium]